jgi:hypothetical protein
MQSAKIKVLQEDWKDKMKGAILKDVCEKRKQIYENKVRYGYDPTALTESLKPNL